MSVLPTSELLWNAATSRHHPAPGDLTALDTVRRVLDERRDVASSTHDRLAELGTAQSSWEGEAADAFRVSLGRLLPDLAKATDSFGRAADAVASFAVALGALQARADTLRPTLQQAEAAHRSAMLDPLRFRGEPSGPALGPVLALVDGISDDYRTAVARCVSAIDDAAEAGIHHTLGTFFAAHAKGLERISDVTEDVATWAGGVELVTAAAAAICAGTVVGAPAAAVLGLISTGAGAVGTAASGVRFYADLGLAVAQHTTDGHVSRETKWDLVEDELGVAVPAAKPGKVIMGAAAGPLEKLAEHQIARLASKAESALQADDMDAFWKAFDRIPRVDEVRESVEELGEKLVDKGVEENGTSGRERVPHETKAAPCP